MPARAPRCPQRWRPTPYNHRNEGDAAVARIDDDGELVLDDIFPDVQTGPEALATVAFGRLHTTEVEGAGGPVRITTERKQWFYAEIVGSWDLVPHRALRGTSHTLRLRLFDVTVDADDLTISLGAGVTVTNVQVVDSVGHVVEFDVAVDLSAPSGPRTVEVTQDGIPLLVADEGFWVTRSLESAGDCASTLDEGVLPDAAWVFSDAGLEQSEFSPADCPSYEPTGREQIVPVSLQAGEVLTARLWTSSVLGVVYFATACGSTGFSCDMTPDRALPATATFVADQAVDLLVVADSLADLDGEPQDMMLHIERSSPKEAVVIPHEFGAGANGIVDVFATGGFALPSEPEAYAFSDGITVESVEIIESDWAEVTIQAPDPKEPISAELNITLPDGSATAPNVLSLIPTLVPPGTCNGIDATDSVGAGKYNVILLQDGIVDETSCQDFLATDAIIPVELGAGETLHATVSGANIDTRIQLMLGCGETMTATRCSDNGLDDWPEYLTWTGPAVPSTVYRVVEAFDLFLGGQVTLELEVTK